MHVIATAEMHVVITTKLKMHPPPSCRLDAAKLSIKNAQFRDKKIRVQSHWTGGGEFFSQLREWVRPNLLHSLVVHLVTLPKRDLVDLRTYIWLYSSKGFLSNIEIQNLNSFWSNNYSNTTWSTRDWFLGRVAVSKTFGLWFKYVAYLMSCKT